MIEYSPLSDPGVVAMLIVSSGIVIVSLWVLWLANAPEEEPDVTDVSDAAGTAHPGGEDIAA